MFDKKILKSIIPLIDDKKNAAITQISAVLRESDSNLDIMESRMIALEIVDNYLITHKTSPSRYLITHMTSPSRMVH